MTRRSVGCLGVILALASAADLVGGEDRAPAVFASGVSAVRLDALVTRGDRVVPGLTAADFEVYDDGVLQSVEIVDGHDEAIHAVLLLDTSESVAGARLQTLRVAADAFIGALWDVDTLTALAFSGRIRWLGLPEDRREFVRASLRTLTAGHNTVLRDAVYTAIKMANPQRGRPLVLVLSDGDDRGSWLSARQVLAVARASDVVVHAVRVTPRGTTSTGLGKHDLLREIASATGGDMTLLSRDEDLQGTFLRILTEFKSRYRLRFEPTSPHEGWHSLSVRLRGKRGTVRARNGYAYRAGRGEVMHPAGVP